MTKTARQKALRKAKQGKKEPRPGCPHPLKRAYEDEAAAVKQALRSSARIGRPIRIYECQCGAHHLTRQKKRYPQAQHQLKAA